MTRTEIIARVRQELNDLTSPYRVSDNVIIDGINQALEMYAEKEPQKKAMSLSMTADVFEYNPKATDALFLRPVKLIYRDSVTNEVTTYVIRYDEFEDRLYVEDPETLTAALHYKAAYPTMDENGDTLDSQIRFSYFLDALLSCCYEYLARKASAGQSDAITTDSARIKSRKVGEVEEDYAVESATSANSNLMKSYVNQAESYKNRFDSHFKTNMFYKL